MKDVINYPALLLDQDNKEVQRFFDAKYVESQFRHYLALKVPLDDIVKFFHKAQVTGADPLKDQIYLIPRNTKIKVNGRDEYVTVGTIVFSYHFVESQAVQTKEYQGYKIETGIDEYFDPIEDQVKKMLRSRCVVKRNGHEYPFTAWWSEYVQTNSYGVNAQWKGKPHLMLEKCAKAGALRAAFPEWLSGAYTEEEMGAIEKDDSAIEAQFQQKGEVEKHQEIEQRLESKAIQAENMDEINLVCDQIKIIMGKLTEGLDLVAKGKAMKEHLGVGKFEEIKSKPLEELKFKKDQLQKIIDDRAAEEVKKSSEKNKGSKSKEKPSFVINEGGSNG